MLRPFLSYTTKAHTTFGVVTESTYDWENSKWTIPLIATVSQLLRVGELPIQLQLGPKWYADGPSSAPDWGIRFAFLLLFPRSKRRGMRARTTSSFVASPALPSRSCRDCNARDSAVPTRSDGFRTESSRS